METKPVDTNMKDKTSKNLNYISGNLLGFSKRPQTLMQSSTIKFFYSTFINPYNFEFLFSSMFYINTLTGLINNTTNVIFS